MKNIATAFIKAKRAFGPVLKVSSNPHFRSKFAPLDVCLEAVDAACLDNGIAVYQETFLDDTGITIETVFLHESGESLRCGKLHVPAAKQDPQGYGSALTYARRYSLLTACGIAPEDDDGNAGSRRTEIKSTVNENQIIDLMAAMDETTTLEDLQKTYKAAYAATNGDPTWQKKVIAHKDAKKSKVGG